MKREPNVDYFDDFLSETGGIHGGRALDALETVSESITRDGLNVKVTCSLCGREHMVTLEWEELFVVGNNGPGRPPILPANWHYSQNNQDAYVQLRCSSCNGPGIAVHELPADAQEACMTARRRGYISDAQIAQWQQSLQRVLSG